MAPIARIRDLSHSFAHDLEQRAHSLPEIISSLLERIPHPAESHQRQRQQRQGQAQVQAQPQPSDPLPSIATRTLRTLYDAPSTVLHPRQNGATTSTVPGSYPSLGIGPDPATIVGITLGSVGGFLLLLWLLYTCMSLNNNDAGSIGTASDTRRDRRRSSRRSTAHRSSRRRETETVEVRTRSSGRPVVVEEIRRSTSRAPPQPPPPPRSVRQSVVDDEVVVIEENSPPRRHKSNKKERRRRSSSARRDGGYGDYGGGGGDVPLRDVRRSSRRDSASRR